MDKGILAAVVAVCAACGGGASATGSGTVSGTIAEQTMVPKDAVSNVLHSGSNSEGLIFITNADRICARLTARQQPRNTQLLIIAIGTQTTSPNRVAAPTGPGVFQVYSSADIVTQTGPAAVVSFASSDVNCTPTSSFEGVTGGTVTLTRVDANGYEGTFDVTFSGSTGSVGHVTGTFSSAQCAVVGSVVTGTCT
jgi:hypothetical protein